MNSSRLEKEGLVVTRVNPHKYVKALYGSIEPPEISHEEALEILDNQSQWEKLNLGKKLNVAKVYASGIAKELDIKSPDAHLAHYKGFLSVIGVGCALSIKDGFALNISQMKIANNVKNTVTEEVRHIRHFYEIGGECDYKPKSILPREVVDYVKNNAAKFPNGWIRFAGDVKYYDRPIEIDADNFVESYTKKIFGEYKASIPENIYGKLSAAVERLALRILMKYVDIITRKLDPETKEEILDEIKSKVPEFSKIMEMPQRKKTVENSTKDMLLESSKTTKQEIRAMTRRMQKLETKVISGEIISKIIRH